jgi:predicted Rossmann fold flavoprotein
MAAIESSEPSRDILVLEKMSRPARKLSISGKGRCNITNDADRKDFLSHFGKNGRFLKHAFGEFFNTDLLNYFEKLGVRFKLERGGRYFPEQDSAVEIVDALLQEVDRRNIPVSTMAEVTRIEKQPIGDFSVTFHTKGQGADKKKAVTTLRAGKVILATGGKSYPGTGSTGTGFSLASRMGHTIKPLLPSIVPLETRGDTAKKLQGLSLRNVSVSAWSQGKKIGEQFGEMLFTDFGISGPAVLTLSRTIVPTLEDLRDVTVYIDLKPALDHKKLDQRLLREVQEHPKQHVSSLLKSLLPKKMIPVFLERMGTPEEKQLSSLDAGERKRLRILLKEFRLEVTGHRSFEAAIVTAGGVCVQEIHPRTMESKLVKGLFFAGEIIDVDADTGGFNLQAAFSTGWLSGRSV